MITSTLDGIKLELNGRTVFSHSAKAPFVSVLTSEYLSKSSHGNFKITEKIKARTPLSDCKIIEDGDERAEIVFSNGAYKLDLTLEKSEKTLRFFFKTDAADKTYEFKFSADCNEGVFGGGEQYRQLNLKGERVINFVSEHIVVKPIVQKTLLKFLPYREKKHSEIETYSPMSTFVSSSLYALRFDADSYGVQDFTDKNVSVFRYAGCPRGAVYVFGDSFKEIGCLLNADTPCNEYLPDWIYGGMILGVQGGIERVEQIADKMTADGVKVCAVWCQDWSGKKVTAAGKQVYWNWEVDENLYPDLKNRIVKLKEKGIRFLAYVNPYLVKDGRIYNEMKDKGFLILHEDGSVYHVKSTTFDAGMIDLTNPGAVNYFKEVLLKKNMLDLGVDGYMADFGEYLPLDCVLYDGNPLELHNQWPTIWARINREAVDSHERAKEIFFFTRSGYNGAASYTPIMWNGDQHTDFSKDYGMPCVMPATFNLGFSGLTAVHSDIGGFISFASLVRDKELFVRWMEMNAFSPVMRSHETISPEANAQPYDEAIESYTSSLTRVHAALADYLKECMTEARQGVPVMRPDFYDSSDFSKHKDLYSYMLGGDVYVCPVIQRGATVREVELVDGEWKAFFSGKSYKGSQKYTVDAPLGTPVAFYRTDSKYADVFSKITL